MSGRAQPRRAGQVRAGPAARLAACLHERNTGLVDSHHPLRETILLQTGLDAEARASFLRARQRVAPDAPGARLGPCGVRELAEPAADTFAW